MALNLAPVQGRYAVTPHGGARVGSRGRRFVTSALGQPGHQPAGTMTGVRGASLEVPHGLAENPPCSACVSRSLAQVEPWDEILPLAESRGGTPRGERAALCARRTPLGCGGWIRVSRRSASLLSSVLTFVAQSADREDTGIHRRCSLAKIGAESEEILPLEQQLGCEPHRENEI